MKITENTRKWLLAAEEPYVQFNIKQFFSIQTNRDELINDPFIKENISLLDNWNREVLKNHSRPQLLIHKLAMLADLGIKAADKPVKPVIKTILDDFDVDGIPRVLIELPVVFGGSGVPEKAWMICGSESWATSSIVSTTTPKRNNCRTDSGLRRLNAHDVPIQERRCFLDPTRVFCNSSPTKK